MFGIICYFFIFFLSGVGYLIGINWGRKSLTQLNKQNPQLSIKEHDRHSLEMDKQASYPVENEKRLLSQIPDGEHPGNTSSRSLMSTSVDHGSSGEATTFPIMGTLRRFSTFILPSAALPKFGTLFTAVSQRNSVTKPSTMPIVESIVSGFPPGFAPKTLIEREGIGRYPDYAELSGVPWPRPYLNFILEKACPRPYRPFRWAYHQTMSLSRLETDWWLEIESTYVERIKQRKELYRVHGKNVLDLLPDEDVELACRELMELVVMWLVKRYPAHFELIDDEESQGCGNTVFVNNILGTKTPLDRREIHPLVVLLENVPEDFAIVLPEVTYGVDGTTSVHYTFRGGVICSAIGWNLGTKLGLTLHDIHHTTGHVPDYASKMSYSMDRFSSRNLPPNKPIQRGSWSLEIGQPLFVPPGDAYHDKVRSFQDPNLRPEDVFLRVDWQTLRRLPISGAVVFNYKAVFTNLTELQWEPKIPALFAKVLKEGKKEILKYKGTWHVEHIVIPELERYARWQVETGMVEDGWEVETLEETPFYKGWKERWNAQQGFCE